MIELALFQNGAGDLPARKLDHKDLYVVDGDLDAVQGMAARTLPAQVRQAILADELGLDYWFQSEHHFLAEGVEFSPAPLLVQAAIASRTKRIRLGQMANIITWWHPLRLAEQTAMLDILSGGRAEVGVGRGYQPRENEVFGATYGSSIQDQERNRSYFEEAYELLIKAWTEPSFQFRGEFYTVPPSWTKWNHEQTIEYFSQEGDRAVGRTVDEVLRVGPPDLYASGNTVVASTTTLRELTVQPQPYQKPYPQIWQPVSSERSLRWAAENGVNGHFPAVATEKLKRSAAIYREESEKHGWPDRLGRGEPKYGWDAEQHRGIGIQKFLHIADKGIGDRRRFDAGLRLTWDYLTPFGLGEVVPPLNDKRAPGAPITTDELYASGLAVCGTKDEIIEGILKTKVDSGFEDFFFAAELALGGLEESEVEEQIACFAEEIAPVLRRECGGGPDLPDVGVDFAPVSRPAAVSA
jgi:alkanesulfonate monooxygenase SsuD/methylene tetrahydromethanopterin reductase-like flavin-dependent oxidoreductase (luciferase family)